MDNAARLAQQDRQQIEYAAGGWVLGTLAEWPYLMGALRRSGYDLPAQTEAWRLRNLCQQIIEATDGR